MCSGSATQQHARLGGGARRGYVWPGAKFEECGLSRQTRLSAVSCNAQPRVQVCCSPTGPTGSLLFSHPRPKAGAPAVRRRVSPPSLRRRTMASTRPASVRAPPGLEDAPQLAGSAQQPAGACCERDVRVRMIASARARAGRTLLNITRPPSAMQTPLTCVSHVQAQRTQPARTVAAASCSRNSRPSRRLWTP